MNRSSKTSALGVAAANQHETKRQAGPTPNVDGDAVGVKKLSNAALGLLLSPVFVAWLVACSWLTSTLSTAFNAGLWTAAILVATMILSALLITGVVLVCRQTTRHNKRTVHL